MLGLEAAVAAVAVAAVVVAAANSAPEGADPSTRETVIIFGVRGFEGSRDIGLLD